MKVVCISDTHSNHEMVKIPECDILLHAGDFSGSGEVWETKYFMEWFSKQPAAHKIFISGNHDFLDQENPNLFRALLSEYPSLTYLRDESVEINGITIWGRPWTPTFYDWAFMKPRGSVVMTSTLDVIPSGIDILLTHGPARGILDLTQKGESVGCDDMLQALPRIQPKFVVFGHIHHSAGIKKVDGVTHVNASVLNDSYKFHEGFSPISFQIFNLFFGIKGDS